VAAALGAIDRDANARLFVNFSFGALVSRFARATSAFRQAPFVAACAHYEQLVVHVRYDCTALVILACG
jgi:hypothetical protein